MVEFSTVKGKRELGGGRGCGGEGKRWKEWEKDEVQETKVAPVETRRIFPVVGNTIKASFRKALPRVLESFRFYTFSPVLSNSLTPSLSLSIFSCGNTDSKRSSRTDSNSNARPTITNRLVFLEECRNQRVISCPLLCVSRLSHHWNSSGNSSLKLNPHKKP